MRVVILGTGDLTKITRFTGITQEKLWEMIRNIADLLVKKGHEMVINPDRGIPLEMAKIYKEKKGKKLLGLVPTKDTRYGIDWIKDNLPLLDERIEVDDWYDVDGEVAASGDVCIVLGMSPGIMRDVTVLKYHYRYLNCKTKVIWFKNTLSNPIPKEIEEEIPITYIESVQELERFL